MIAINTELFLASPACIPQLMSAIIEMDDLSSPWSAAGDAVLAGSQLPQPVTYDYLAELKRLIGSEHSKLYDECFGKHINRKRICDVVLCDGAGQRFFIKESPVAAFWKKDNFILSMEELRAIVLNEDDLVLKACKARSLLIPTKPYVLVVEDINEDWIQLLGAAVDLDPAFLSQYLNPQSRQYDHFWLNREDDNRPGSHSYSLQNLAGQFRLEVEQKRAHTSTAVHDSLAIVLPRAGSVEGGENRPTMVRSMF